MATEFGNLQEQAQQLLDFATGSRRYKVKNVAHFDYSDVISTEPYNLEIGEDGTLSEEQMFFRIYNEGGIISGITLYMLPIEVTEQYQSAIRVSTKNLFERTITNLPHVLSLLEQCGYKWDDQVRFWDVNTEAA